MGTAGTLLARSFEEPGAILDDCSLSDVLEGCTKPANPIGGPDRFEAAGKAASQLNWEKMPAAL